MDIEVNEELDINSFTIYETLVIDSLNALRSPADGEMILQIVSVTLDAEQEAIAADVMSAIDALLARGAIAIESGLYKLTSLGDRIFELMVI